MPRGYMVEGSCVDGAGTGMTLAALLRDPAPVPLRCTRILRCPHCRLLNVLSIFYLFVAVGDWGLEENNE